jgi:methyl-accepting chemotaxis protein
MAVIGSYATRMSETERAENERQRAASHAEVTGAINALAVGLERLSRGELNFTLNEPFGGDLDRLRQNFNASIGALSETLSKVKQTSDVIHQNGGQIAQAVQNLSHRTENQAAVVEEAAAAIQQISENVSNTSSKTSLALTLVQETKNSADASGSVVMEAVNAMQRIRDASDEISAILALIDDIAFQTNLLALNAGVEAARAGDAGKGFAVVAHEVRELAQRCAQSSRKINGLIKNSAEEVSNGARCVANTSDSLHRISQQVTSIFGHVQAIAAASLEQAASLKEVNSSINGIDTMTQENAAMVEETHTASGCLAKDADFLTAIIDEFVLEGGGQASFADAA